MFQIAINTRRSSANKSPCQIDSGLVSTIPNTETESNSKIIDSNHSNYNSTNSNNSPNNISLSEETSNKKGTAREQERRNDQVILETKNSSLETQDTSNSNKSSPESNVFIRRQSSCDELEIVEDIEITNRSKRSPQAVKVTNKTDMMSPTDKINAQIILASSTSDNSNKLRRSLPVKMEIDEYHEEKSQTNHDTIMSTPFKSSTQYPKKKNPFEILNDPRIAERLKHRMNTTEADEVQVKTSSILTKSESDGISTAPEPKEVRLDPIGEVGEIDQPGVSTNALLGIERLKSNTINQPIAFQNSSVIPKLENDTTPKNHKISFLPSSQIVHHPPSVENSNNASSVLKSFSKNIHRNVLNSRAEQKGIFFDNPSHPVSYGTMFIDQTTRPSRNDGAFNSNDNNLTSLIIDQSVRQSSILQGIINDQYSLKKMKLPDFGDINLKKSSSSNDVLNLIEKPISSIPTVAQPSTVEKSSTETIAKDELCRQFVDKITSTTEEDHLQQIAELKKEEEEQRKILYGRDRKRKHILQGQDQDLYNNLLNNRKNRFGALCPTGSGFNTADGGLNQFTPHESRLEDARHGMMIKSEPLTKHLKDHDYAVHLNQIMLQNEARMQEQKKEEEAKRTTFNEGLLRFGDYANNLIETL